MEEALAILFGFTFELAELLKVFVDAFLCEPVWQLLRLSLLLQVTSRNPARRKLVGSLGGDMLPQHARIVTPMNSKSLPSNKDLTRTDGRRRTTGRICL